MAIFLMIISFLLYPFYSFFYTILKLFKFKYLFSFQLMRDFLFVMTFVMVFGDLFIAFASFLLAVSVPYLLWKFLGFSNLLSFSVGLITFIISYWFFSFVVYIVQSLALLSSHLKDAREILKKIENTSKDITDNVLFH